MTARRTPNRTGASLVALLLLAALTAGCEEATGEETAGRDGRAPLEVVATMTIVGDLAEQVGGEAVDVEVVVPVGADPHTFEPRPSDAETVEGADFLVSNGGGLEERWLSDMLARSDAEHVALAEGLDARVFDEGEDAGEPDPHFWNDPVIVRDHYVPALVGALAEALPEGEADALAERAEAYTAELDALDAWAGEAVETIPAEQRKLVTTHDAFAYFGERYGVEVPGSLYGVSTESEPSPAEVTELVETIREQEVVAVFVETLTSPELMERVAGEAGVELGEDLLGDSVGEEEGTDTYVGMMVTNISAIVEGLGGQPPAWEGGRE